MSGRTITILDHDNGRTIVARVPDYLKGDGEDVAQAIFSALGISSETEYMLGDFDLVLADFNADSSRDARGIELLTQDFKLDALAALKEAQEL